MSTKAALHGLLIAMSVFAWSSANAVPTGCDLAFLPDTTSSPPPVIIDGSIGASEWAGATLQQSGTGTCLRDLLDGTSMATLSAYPVQVYTKRDNSNLYIAFNVTDATIPPSAAVAGDQVVLQFNPNNSRDTALAGDESRLVITNMRGSPGANSVAWRVRNSSTGGWGGTASVPTVTPSGPTSTLANGVQVGIANLVAGAGVALGYVVEVKVPFTAIGYSATPPNYADIGLAIAIVNDTGFQAEVVPGEGNVEVLTGVAFPETTSLPLVNSSPEGDPLSSIAGSAWRNPSQWGTAYLSGAGDAIWISRNYPWWNSEDIRVGFCNAATFDEAVPGSAKWYRYKSTSPCLPRLWTRIHRNAPSGVGDVKRRVLMLWAEHGSNPQKWYFAHLSDPVALSPGAAVVTPGKEWSNVPPDKGTHPCLRSFILPDSLSSTYDLAFFQGIGTETGNNESKIQNFVNAYGLAEFHIAQMNIAIVGSVTCPACVPCAGCVSSRVREWLRMARLSLIGDAFAQDNRMIFSREGEIQAKFKGAVVDFFSIGVMTKRVPGKGYRFVDDLGGVRKIIEADYLLKTKKVALPFNVSNSGDGARIITVAHRLYSSDGLPKVGLSIERGAQTYKEGETRQFASSLNLAEPPTDGPTGPDCPIFKKASASGAFFAVAGVGFWWSRRRRKSGRDSDPD